MFKLILAAVSAVLILGGTALSTQASTEARVRVVHASPDAPAVDVYANGARVLSTVPFKAASDYLAVPAGKYTFEIRPAGASATSSPVLTATADLAAGTDYTVMAVDRVSQIKARVFVDNNGAPAAGKAHVQIVHASPDAPNVDISVKGGPVLVPNLPFGEQKGPLPVDAGTYDLEVRVAGTATVALPLNGVRLESGKVYTFAAMGLVSGDPALTVVPLTYTPAAAAHVAPPRAGDGGLATGTSSTDNTNLFVALMAATAFAGTLLAGRMAVERTRK